MLIKRSDYIGYAGDFKGRPFRYHYFRTSIQGTPSLIIVRQERGKLCFYSIVEENKEITLRISTSDTV